MLEIKVTRLLWSAMIFGGFFVPSISIAEDEARCAWYVKRALQHAQINIQRKCGHSGPEWATDRDMHAAWCAKASPEQIKDVMTMRSQALEACSQ